MNKDAKTRFSIAIYDYFDKKGIPERGRATILKNMFSISQQSARDWIEGLSLPNKNKWDEIYSRIGINIASLLINEKIEKPSHDSSDIKIFDIYSSTNIEKADFQLISSEIRFCPSALNLGKYSILLFSKDELVNTYRLYELLKDGVVIQVLRKIRQDGFDTYLIPDGQGVEYRIADYEHKFMGSLIGVKVIF